MWIEAGLKWEDQVWRGGKRGSWERIPDKSKGYLISNLKT